MRVFISWSGNLSHRVALILRDWLPNVIQVVDPYVSSEDLDKGTRWASDISKELAGASLGIICLTRSNLEAPWILFEAGALSKSMEKSRVVPLLIDISPSDIEGPLVQFQAASIMEDDIRKMVKDVNASIGELSVDPRRIDKSFQKWWPELDRALQEAKSQTTGSKIMVAVRSERELLEETLDLARQISKNTAKDFETTMAHDLRIMLSRFPLFQMTSEDPRIILEELQRGLSALIVRHEKTSIENLNLRDELEALRREVSNLFARNEKIKNELSNLRHLSNPDRLSKLENRLVQYEAELRVRSTQNEILASELKRLKDSFDISS